MGRHLLNELDVTTMKARAMVTAVVVSVGSDAQYGPWLVAVAAH